MRFLNFSTKSPTSIIMVLDNKLLYITSTFRVIEYHGQIIGDSAILIVMRRKKTMNVLVPGPDNITIFVSTMNHPTENEIIF